MDWSAANLARMGRHQAESLLGLYLASSATIHVDGEMPHEVARETFLHEVLHAIIGQTGLSSEGGPLHGDAEEQVVATLSPLLMDVLLRNPHVVDYLTG